ncbi:single-stranded DNA-binding protein [Brucella cytisi]|jgi:single-strand DNA-binding protein|uniref:Single-stranded DNA-binding protein n=1 Tax=Brucella cytisi TaxID=407152 RepID=A0A1J6HCC3_9HYPH|nr:single-stranded DNA-binding protein [Brucella cytisi]OIS90233.1 hypothetical protein BLA27_27895 [Brucella cytisi]
MSNEFHAPGNLGKDPELRTVEVKGEQREVLDFSVYVDRHVSDGNNGFKEKGSFWLNGSLWGRRAVAYAEVLKKGMRVRVGGELVADMVPDRETGKEYPVFKLEADYIAIDPITYARKSN